MSIVMIIFEKCFPKTQTHTHTHNQHIMREEHPRTIAAGSFRNTVNVKDYQFCTIIDHRLILCISKWGGW